MCVMCISLSSLLLSDLKVWRLESGDQSLEAEVLRPLKLPLASEHYNQQLTTLSCSPIESNTPANPTSQSKPSEDTTEQTVTIQTSLKSICRFVYLRERLQLAFSYSLDQQWKMLQVQIQRKIVILTFKSESSLLLCF